MKKPRAQRKRERIAGKIKDLQGRVKELRSLANLAIERRAALEVELKKCRSELAGWEEWERRVNSMLPPMSALRREVEKIAIQENVFRLSIPTVLTSGSPESIADTQHFRAIDPVQQRQITLHRLECCAHMHELTDALVVDIMIGGNYLKRFFSMQTLISMPQNYMQQLISAEIAKAVKNALKSRVGG